MSNNTANTNKRKYLEEVALQVEMAINSKDTSKAVKDCLKTIVFEASNETGLPLGDMNLVREALPNIIESLGFDYGRGVMLSLSSILRMETTAVRDYYAQRLDEKPAEDKPAISQADAENKELNNWKILHKKLDDRYFAQEYQAQMQRRAENIIGDFLAITSGGSVLTEEHSEWGNAAMLELLDIFSTHHENISIAGLCDRLQSHIWQWSLDYSNHYLNWYRGSMASRGLDGHGLPLESADNSEISIAAESISDLSQTVPLDLSNCAPDQLDTKLSELSTMKDVSCALAGLLHNPLLPARLHEVISDEMTLSALTDTPEFIEANLEAMKQKEKSE